jgi:hypothetical protein
LKNQQAARNANSQPDDIQERIPFSFQQVPQGDFEIVRYHNFLGCMSLTFISPEDGKTESPKESYRIAEFHSSLVIPGN